MNIRHRHLLAGIAGIVLVSGLGFGALSLRGAGSSTQAFDLSRQPARIVGLYAFVDGSPELAARIPCYCGCGVSLEHTSLLDCFVAPDGGGFESHASACAICTDEAEDVRRLALQGMDMAKIRTWIDAEYGVFGAPTDTP